MSISRVNKEIVVCTDTYAMEYYSAKRKKKSFHLQQHRWTLKALCNVKLSQTMKDIYCITSLTYIESKNKQRKKQNQAHRYGEQIGCCQRWAGGWAKWVKGVKRYSCPVIKLTVDIMYSMMAVANSTVLHS